MTTAARAETQRRFNLEGGLLLATDAAAEGLNLQRRCRTVLNFELPWNPARLEQRIGRVDRIGQERTVHAITLVARDTAEDLVIANMAKRLTRVAATLGDHDRLASFLSDTRTAQIVIGGAPAVIEIEPVKPAVVVAAPTAIDGRTLRAAEQIAMRRDPRGAAAVVGSSVRASRALPPGFVVAIRYTAETSEGRIEAERVVLLHAIADVSKPLNAADVRSAAQRAMDEVSPRAIDDMPGLQAWLADVAREHNASVQRRLEREVALGERAHSGSELQPGLFDARAVRQAEREASLSAEAQREHSRRIRLLESERVLITRAAVAGVLVVWR